MKDIFNKNYNGYTLLYYKIIKKVKNWPIHNLAKARRKDVIQNYNPSFFRGSSMWLCKF